MHKKYFSITAHFFNSFVSIAVQAGQAAVLGRLLWARHHITRGLIFFVCCPDTHERAVGKHRTGHGDKVRAWGWSGHRHRQRWASTLTSQSNAQHLANTRPSIERSDRSYFFEKPKAKIVPSTAIFSDGWRSRSLGIDFYTFNEKKHRVLYLDFSKGLR